MQNSKHSLRMCVAACTLAVGTALGTIGGMASAMTITGDLSHAPISQVQADSRGSLTLQVTPVNPYDDASTGAHGTKPFGGVAGTTFTVSQLSDVDLSTAAGWGKAQAMSLKDAQKAPKGVVKQATTDADGTAVINDLPVGLYLVTAEVPEDLAHWYHQPQDMLVTIPVFDQDSSWNYNVVINAKNTPTTDPSTSPVISPTSPATPVTHTEKVTTTVRATDPAAGSETPAPAPPAPSTTPSGGSSVRDALARTGASVLSIIVAALLMVAAGALLIMRSTNRTLDEGGK